MEPLSSFFVALCDALQEGENELTAIDAYWLGLVVEVFGEQLWSLRAFEEYKPDAQPDTISPAVSATHENTADKPSIAKIEIQEPADALTLTRTGPLPNPHGLLI